MSGDKKELVSILSSTLKGAQRVPSLIIANPRLPLSELNIQEYMVLDSEPLKNLKGHLINLLTELPHVLDGSQKNNATINATIFSPSFCTQNNKN